MENPDNILWNELKFGGMCVNKRSYHSAAIHNFYVYGGYEVHQGQISDFLQVDLQENGKWENVPYLDNGIYPGPLHRHSGVVIGDNYLIFGGQIKLNESSNLLYIYNFESRIFTKTQGKNCPPMVDSHSACVFNDTMLIFGGYQNTSKQRYSNNIYQYSQETDEWRKLTENANGQFPEPRQGSGMVLIKNVVYIFGGTKNNEKLRDLWAFDLNSSTWSEIQLSDNFPSARNGHSMVVYKDKIFLFGGIHDITHEQNDLHMFDPAKQLWSLLEENSLVQNQFDSNSKQQSQIQNKQTLQKHTQEQQINEETTKTNQKSKKQSQQSTFIQQRDYNKYKSVASKNTDKETLESQQNQVKEVFLKAQDKIKKKRQQKKLELLAEFQMSEEQKQNFEINSPTTEALRNSIKSLGTNLNKNKDVASTFIKVKQLFQLNEYQKRPCARDGHSAILENDTMLIFGGDRHLMSFNDIYAISLLELLKQQ